MTRAPGLSIVPCSAKSRRQTPCATAGLAQHIHRLLSSKFPMASLLDIGGMDLPIFDGRGVDEYKSEPLTNAAIQIARSGAILWVIPCYWGNVGPVFQNAINLLAGPGYDQKDTPPHTTFSDKLVSVIAVGADDTSAGPGGECAIRVLQAVGASPVGHAVAIHNPRNNPMSAQRESEVRILALSLLREHLRNV